MTIEDLLIQINNLPSHISHSNRVVKRNDVIKLIRRYQYALAGSLAPTLEGEEVKIPELVKEKENETN